MAPSLCPRRTNLGHGLNVRSGSGSTDPGIFGYFPSLESTSPGGEISPADPLHHTTHPRHPVNTGRRGIFYAVQEMKEGGLT